MSDNANRTGWSFQQRLAAVAGLILAFGFFLRKLIFPGPSSLNGIVEVFYRLLPSQ